MMRYILPLILVLGIAAVMVIGPRTAQPRADLTFINISGFRSIDPASMSWNQEIRLALQIWEGLCVYHPQTNEAIPGCAFQPEISEDKRTYTFRIRPNAKWNNGDPVTAHDFVYAWRRASEPGTAGDYAFFFDLIEGMKEYVAWRIQEIQGLGQIKDTKEKLAARDAHLAEADRRFEQIVALQALDDKTLRVRLIRPVAYFLDLCAFSTLLPVHSKSVEHFKIVSEGGLIYYSEQWVKPYNTYYNGPFYMTEWKFKRSIRLAKNPYYWDHDRVKLNTIEMLHVDDSNTAWLLYSGGRADWLPDAEMDYVPKLLETSTSPFEVATNKTGTKRNDIHAWPAFGTYFYNFNCKDKLPDGRANPFADPRVRQAFTMAIDKQQLVDQVVRRGNPVATTFVPVGTITGYPEVSGLPYDPQKARQLLTEAGFPDGKDFLEVVILFNTGFQHGDIAQAILSMWKSNLGVRGRIEGKEVKTFGEDKRHTNFIICRGSWYGDYWDPTTFLEMFQTDNGNNDSAYSDTRYDQMLADAEKETNPQRRLEKLAEAERYLINEGLPLLPIYRYVNIFAFDPDKVKGLYLTPRRMTMLRAVEVVR